MEIEGEEKSSRELTPSELMARFSQISNPVSAMRIAIDRVRDSIRLHPKYRTPEIKPLLKYSDIFENLFGKPSIINGYFLSQQMPLANPIEQRRGLLAWAFDEKKKLITHEERNLVYADIFDKRLDVLVNDKYVLQVCENTAELSGNQIRVRLCIE